MKYSLLHNYNSLIHINAKTKQKTNKKNYRDRVKNTKTKDNNRK